MNPLHPKLSPRSFPRAGLVAVAAALLAACGGADPGPGAVPPEALPQPPADAAASVPPVVEPSAEVADRRFELWAPAQALAVRESQRSLEPEGQGNGVRLLVRLNPAAVSPVSRAAIAAAPGEAGDASALRQRELAAKSAAVATSAQALMAQTVLRVAPGATLRQHYAHALEGFALSVPWSEAQALADALARLPAVDSVELDQPLSLAQAGVSAPSPERPIDARAWGVDRIDQRARAFDGRFRASLDGRGVTVYVVDTGVSPHREFGTRLRSGFSAVADGQGTRDCQGHGTHVAATAVGATVGVAPGAAVVPVRVLDCQGSGSSSQLLAGLDWVAAQGAQPGVVNLSLGGPVSAALDAAAQRLAGLGFSVVAAAGNSNADACLHSPARATGVLAVAASDPADAKAAFSNWGACVALWAPGTQIGSAGHASAEAVAVKSGTSMAAPHVAGAAALQLQAQPTATAQQVMQRLLQKATPALVLATPGSMTRSLLYAGDAGDAGAAPGVPPASPVVPPTTTPTAPAPAPAPNLAVRPGAIAMAALVPAVGAWSAQATVTVVDAQGQPVAAVRVAGRFSNMTTEVSCTSGRDGRCTLASAAAPWSAVPTLGFAITSLVGAQMRDAGGGLRSAQVARPAAPVATLSSLSGTELRSAGSPAWRPQFSLTLLDEARRPVAGAWVQTTLNVHAGSRVVGVQTAGCVTGATGQCRIDWAGPLLGASHSGAALTVTGVTRSFLVWRPGNLTRATVGRVS